LSYPLRSYRLSILSQHYQTFSVRYHLTPGGLTDYRCENDRWKVVGGIYFTNKWRVETLQPGLEFDNFKPLLKSGIFKCISWLNGSCFEGAMTEVF
jgi:hypothetical protein